MKHLKHAFAILMLATWPLAAWDIPGHMIVAQIAYGRLNTNAAAHLTQLAGQLKLGQHTYNPVNMAAGPTDQNGKQTDKRPLPAMALP